MGKIFYDGTGKVVAMARTDNPGERVTQPAGTSALSFDEDTNPLLADDTARHGIERHTVIAGVLKRDGVTVPLAAEGPVKNKRAMIRARLAALDAGTATGNQAQDAIAWCVRQILEMKGV